MAGAILVLALASQTLVARPILIGDTRVWEAEAIFILVKTMELPNQLCDIVKTKDTL